MKIKKILIITLIVISSMIYTNSVILGVGGSDDEDSNYLENVDADYLNGKELAYNGNYEDAIVYLKKSIETDPKNADAFNMLGYSNRKLGNNQEAFKYYNKSLKLDPRHKGSHEYIGRLYLNLNQPEKAKMHLDRLDSICFFGCDEYSTLKKAIEDYEKNKVVKNY
tara:strand:+ start:337 stop:834 length:498 start_codon:yes stop_codon:yes gene_type:complete